MTMDDAYATCVIGYHLARLVGEDKVKEIVTEGEWDDPAVLQMAQDIEELASNGYYFRDGWFQRMACRSEHRACTWNS